MTDAAPDDAPDPSPPRRHRRWPWVLAALVVVVPVVAFVGLRWASEPDDPSDFYDPPEAITGDPGTVLRTEAIDSPSSAMDLHRVLYASEDEAGTPIAVSAVVAVPTGAAPDGGWPVVAWAHGTTGIVPGCAPSLLADGGTGRWPGLATLVEGGAVVVGTDYPGLGTPGIHPYLIGESEGRAVLDSVRAAHDLLGDDVRSETVVYGHSQGGHATLFAAALAPTYAPELDLLGAAPMAPPTDLGKLMDLDIDEPAGSVLTSMAVTAWSDLYPEADLATITEASARPAIAEIAADCIPDTTVQELADAPAIVSLHERGFFSTDPRQAPGWKELLASSSPSTTEAVAAPLLVTQGLADTIVRPEITEDWVRAQCALGAQIETTEYPGVSHFQVRTVAEPEVVGWILQRIAGEAPADGCVTTTGEG